MLYYEKYYARVGPCHVLLTKHDMSLKEERTMLSNLRQYVVFPAIVFALYRVLLSGLRRHRDSFCAI